LIGAFLQEKKMSWFKRRPTTKEPIHRRPQHSSPASEKMFQKTKESSPQNTSKQPKPDK